MSNFKHYINSLRCTNYETDTSESLISVKVDKKKNRFNAYSGQRPGFTHIKTYSDEFYKCYDEYLDKIGYIDSEYDEDNYEKSEEYKPIKGIYSQIANLEVQISVLQEKAEELNKIKSQQDIKVKQEFLDKFKDLYPEYIV